MTDNTDTAHVMRNEWSYMIEEDDIGSKPVRFEISPSEEEKAALCSRLGLLSLPFLKASLELRRKDGSMVVDVHGKIEANVVQECVVTLEPVEDHIAETFEAWFADSTKAVSFAKAKRERMTLKEKDESPILEEYDDPEPIVDGKIDLGELVAQYLSLFLNPYPRAAGVPHNEETEEKEKLSDQYKNPFAALKDWKERGGRQDH